MNTDLDLYQKEPNCVWYTDKPIFCIQTGKQLSKGYNVMVEGVDIGIYSPESFRELAYKIFSKHELLYMRMILSCALPTNSSKKKERSDMSLKLRYEVLKRDKFRCKKCGNDALKSTLEIDHIIPVSKGGKSILSNLETLCYECNHGKGCEI